MSIKVQNGTRGTDHLCEDCAYAHRIGHERESDDEHFCTANDEGVIRLRSKVTVCSKFHRAKMNPPPISGFPMWVVAYSDDGTPVFLEPGEPGGMSYEDRRKYINGKAAVMNQRYGPTRVHQELGSDHGDY